MTYVIQSTHNLTNKDGKEHTMISYFEHHAMGLFNVMVGQPGQAKRYDFRTEAVRDKRRYFGSGNKNKNVKIVKV